MSWADAKKVSSAYTQGEISNLVCDKVKSRVGMRHVKSRVEFQGTRSPDLFLISGIHIANENALVHLAGPTINRSINLYKSQVDHAEHGAPIYMMRIHLSYRAYCNIFTKIDTY